MAAFVRRMVAFGLKALVLVGILAAACAPTPAAPTQQPSGRQAVPGAPSEIKVGLVTFLSGAASGPFGIPARNAAEVWVDKLNREGASAGPRSSW